FFRGIPGSLGVILSNFPAVRAITCLCVAAFLVQCAASLFVVRSGGAAVPLDCVLSAYLGLNWPLFSHGCVWQPVTYAFLHGSLLHIFLNLFTLIFFGYSVEELLGSRRFWLIFLVSAAIGGIGWMAFDIVEPRFWQTLARTGPLGLRLAQRWGEAQGAWLPYNVCVGASGGVFGLVGAFAALCPRRRISLLLFYVIPVTLEARQMALLLAAFNLFELVTSLGHVAYVAHLLGGLAGYLLARHYARTRRCWRQYYA
ncbi:MAG: rhomboid family intramembrane serine protease, partial [Kiritimatiellae bacterium]|nr:rhomboid family intramembrane serine protease [Kiritimatiellia bacterium]